MKFSKWVDVLLNIVAPVLIGCLCYLAANHTQMPTIVKNYLADGLWAYAFISSILIIWQRQVNIFWISLTFLIAIGYELLQHYRIVAGSGDVYDIFTYNLFFIIALKCNPYFETRFYTQKATHAKS